MFKPGMCLSPAGLPDYGFPDDVAVIGVDDNEMLCELSIPPLSSVEPAVRRIGYEAARLLDQLMQRKKLPQLQYAVAPKGIVTRRSTEVLATGDPEVRNAVAFIRDHAAQDIRVSDVAAAIGVSRSTLERRFREKLSQGVHTIIHRTRIENARRLIAASDMPLKQVAVLSGFRRLSYMTTLFRRQFSMTPAQYRKDNRHSPN